MIIQVDFGSAQTGIGYRFYDNAGAFVGARVTAGINAGPQTGVYLKDVTPGAGAIGVYWDCDDANFAASEDFEQRLKVATNLDATISSRSSHSAADVWAVTTRTLSSFGTLIADIWAAATRTLTAISDSSGVTTLLSRLSSTRAGLLDNLDAAISSRSTYAGADTAGTTTLLARLTNTRATLLDNLSLLDAAISSISSGGSAGTGALAVTVTVKDGSNNLLQNATVRLTEGINSFTALTNASGVATFNLDAATYALAITKAGYSFAGSSIVVSAAGNNNATMTAIVIAPPADPDQAACYITTRDGQGNAVADIAIFFQLLAATDADSYRSQEFEARSDAAGLLEVALLQGARYRAKRAFQFKIAEHSPAWVEFTVPAATTFALPQILGTP